MKSIVLLIASTSAAFDVTAGDSAIPSAFPAERYEAMTAKSPFALATPPAPVAAAPDKSFADGWYVTSLAQLDGKDFVTIKSRDLAVQLSLFGTEPKDGVAVQKVDWSTGIGRSTVTIVKDGQTAKLEFNQAELQSSGGGSAAAPPPMPAGAVRSPVMGQPMAAKPVVPRPGQPVVQPQQFGGLPAPSMNNGIPRPGSGNTTLPAPAPDSRRRIRVINNVPSQ